MDTNLKYFVRFVWLVQFMSHPALCELLNLEDQKVWLLSSYVVKFCNYVNCPSWSIQSIYLLGVFCHFVRFTWECFQCFVPLIIDKPVDEVW